MTIKEGVINIGKREENKIKHYQETHKIVDDIEYKICAECKEWYPLNKEYFYKWKYSTVDGYRGICKECDKERTKKHQAKDPEKHKKDSLSWHHKNKVKILPRFKARRKVKKEQDRMTYEKYMKNHPEKAKQYSKNRQEVNHRITDEEWDACKFYFNHRCAYCGLLIEEHFVLRRKKLAWIDFSKEHVVFKGKDNLKNCIPSCNSCNSEKWEHPLNYWYNPNNPKYTYERYHKIYMWIRYDYKKYIQKRKPKGKYIKKDIEYWNNK
jgi:hypothetical protein